MLVLAIIHQLITFSARRYSDHYEQDPVPNLWLDSLPRFFFRPRRLKQYVEMTNMNLNVCVQLLKILLFIVVVAHWIGCLHSEEYNRKGLSLLER